MNFMKRNRQYKISDHNHNQNNQENQYQCKSLMSNAIPHVKVNL